MGGWSQSQQPLGEDGVQPELYSRYKQLFNYYLIWVHCDLLGEKKNPWNKLVLFLL